jgi:Sulfotransferase family
MPIFRINDQLHYFAHVPKCGGTSIEAYLVERFGPLAFKDPKGRHLIPEADVWNKGYAQHIQITALERLIPLDWFATSFAVVRHPVRRLISAFFYVRDVQRKGPVPNDINAWFHGAASRILDAPHDIRTTHILPQTGLVPPNARTFRFEDGLDAIPAHLDQLAGNADGPRTIPAQNIGRWRADEPPPRLSDATLDLVARTYAADFARFGYAPPATDSEVAALVDLPILAATGQPPASPPRAASPPIRRQKTFAQHLYRTLIKRVGP